MSDKMNVIKALSESSQNTFEMEDVSPLIQREEVEPKLLTALLGGTVNNIMLQTNTVKYDELEDTAQMVAGKRFDEYGARLTKDRPRQLIYNVGSFGITGNVKPGDVVNRRVPGSSELMGTEYLVARMSSKAAKSWSMFDELNIAELVTKDQNLTLGGPQAQYNYYNDITGSTRVADFGGDGKISMQLAADTDHWELFTEQVDLLETDLEKTGNSASMIVCICGKSFFAQRLEIERQAGLARDLRSELDLQSMGVPVSSFGSGRFNYQYFDSPMDGIRYIRYAANILGTKLIGDAEGYLIPVGAETFLKMAYSPAQTEQFVNTVAATSYAWQETHDRRGTTLATEKNVLGLSVNPQLVRQLKV